MPGESKASELRFNIIQELSSQNAWESKASELPCQNPLWGRFHSHEKISRSNAYRLQDLIDRKVANCSSIDSNWEMKTTLKWRVFLNLEVMLRLPSASVQQVAFLT
ncbi:uncharacterized protein LOC122024976 isoform X3 [Zingiber officinale]|uniref:uncharacterized protein LOC122024976 isoform X3 n=1 Tax=Zingiber officinale TaxID=94328 RepID=UPI001C4CC0B8|nr:uncharacterized protein LOC122024976 isoform X3 [Zingiber officinale]